MRLAPLPKLPDLYCGVYVREGGALAIYEQLAEETGMVINASRSASRKIAAVADLSLQAGTAA